MAMPSVPSVKLSQSQMKAISSPNGAITGPLHNPMGQESAQSAVNFHGNLLNRGADDTSQNKEDRLLAMKRRMMKP